MLDYQNQIFILKNVVRDYYKDGEKVEKPQGGIYIVTAPGIDEAKIKIPGELLIEKPSKKIFQAVIFKDLELNQYARDSKIITSGSATDVMVICNDVLGLVANNVNQGKTHNLKIKATE